MFQVYERSGRLICECPNEDTARDRLQAWPQAYYIQEVVELRRLVAIKEESRETCQQPTAKAPF